jgi:hypothetical protein
MRRGVEGNRPAETERGARAARASSCLIYGRLVNTFRGSFGMLAADAKGERIDI